MATTKCTAIKARRNKKASKTATGTEDRAELLAKIKADFDARLAAMAAEPARWVEFIDHVATFGARYSLGNQILLLIQAAERDIEPRYFLPYGKKDGSTGWKAHSRHVRAGEKAFKIWAPIRRRPTEEQAGEWEAAGRKVAREPSGRPAVQVVGFGLVNTFELSQTDGEPFEPPTAIVRRRIRQRGGDGPRLLTGDDPTGVFDDLVALIKDQGYTFELTAPRTGRLGTANGITVRGPGTQLVQVRDDVDPAQRTKTTMHELAHIRCAHLDDASGQDLHRGRFETEAESVAHIVLRAMGLDSAAYSDAYVFGWADGDLDLVKQCAETVLRVARQILGDLTPADEIDPAADHTAGDPTEPDLAAAPTAGLEDLAAEVA
jgi:hypothetical protein